jgi:ABC-type Fe3+ transport system substrate-binding protein
MWQVSRLQIRLTMRAAIWITLFAIVLVLPYAMRGAVSHHAPAVEGTTRLVVITPHSQEIREEFSRAFSRWYRRKFDETIVLDYRLPGGTNDILRQLTTTYRAARDAAGHLPANFRPEIDVAWGGGDYFFDVELKRQANVLEPMNLDPGLLSAAFPSPKLAGVRLYDYSPEEGTDQRPYWVGVCLSSFGIVYNSDLYRSLDLPPPRQWTDLVNTKLDGLIALADPTHSGSIALAYMMVLQRAMADAEAAYFRANPGTGQLSKAELAARPDYQAAIARGWKEGMSRLMLIAANARYFTASASEIPNEVGNGDAAAGIAIDFYGRVLEEQVGPQRCHFLAPVAATAISPDPVGILDGVKGERYVAANRFVEFLLSREGQRLWNVKAGEPGGPMERSLRRLPIRRDVYADQSGWADPVNPFQDASGFNERADWMALFGETRLMWRIAWIDNRDALKRAYRAVLAVGDTSRRQELLEKLADVPVTMQDLADAARTRKELTSKHEDLAGWSARYQIALARRFYEHYRQVAREAKEEEAPNGKVPSSK